jgi:hypothetical protein
MAPKKSLKKCVTLGQRRGSFASNMLQSLSFTVSKKLHIKQKNFSSGHRKPNPPLSLAPQFPYQARKSSHAEGAAHV